MMLISNTPPHHDVSMSLVLLELHYFFHSDSTKYAAEALSSYLRSLLWSHNIEG